MELKDTHAMNARINTATTVRKILMIFALPALAGSVIGVTASNVNENNTAHVAINGIVWTALTSKFVLNVKWIGVLTVSLK